MRQFEERGVLEALLDDAWRILDRLRQLAWEQEREALHGRLRSVEALVSAPVFQEMLWRLARLLRQCVKPEDAYRPCRGVRYNGILCTQWSIVKRRNGLLWPAKVEIEGCHARAKPLETPDEIQLFLHHVELLVD